MRGVYVLVLAAAACGPAHAQTLSVTNLAAIRSNISGPPSSFFGPQGQTLFLQAAVTDVNGVYANDGVFALPAYTKPPTGGGFYSEPMMMSPSFGGQPYWQAYAPVSYSNPWTLQFGDKGGLGAPVQTQAEIIGPPLPFATGITISGDPSHPTFNWSHPATPALSGSFFVIYDGELEVFGAPAGPGVVQYTLPPASAGGYDLVPGHLYTFNVAGYALRPGQTTLCGNVCIAATSDTFVAYMPLPAGSPLVHVPGPNSNDPNPIYLHGAGSRQAQYDTYVASSTNSRYAFRSLSGPTFRSVTLPAGQTADYTVTYFSGSTSTSANVAPGKTLDFPAGGTSVFVVTGILQQGFVAGLRFTRSGIFEATQSTF